MSDCTTYVGLDTHKVQHQVAMLLPGQDRPQEWTVANNARSIRRMVRRVQAQAPGPVQFCYEAGVCGFGLQRLIEAAGVRCKVVAPSLTPRRPGDRVKTNRRDAVKLAVWDRAGLLTAVVAPTAQEESVRELCRCRDAAQRDLRRARQRVSKFLVRRGRVYGDGKQWTQRHGVWVGTQRLAEPLDDLVLTEMCSQVDQRKEVLAGLDCAVLGVAQESPWREPVGWLRCFHGIDTVTALALVSELYQIERFAHPRGLMSYVGLTPSEDSSGDHRRQGGISKAGNGRVRRLLIEAAWHQRRGARPGRELRRRRQGQPAWVLAIARRAHKRLYLRYRRLVHRGKSPAAAVTAVARELVGYVWEVLRTGWVKAQQQEGTCESVGSR